MPWPIYSVRFIFASGEVGSYNYTVPVGYRAVLTDLVVGNPLSVADQVQVQLQGKTLWRHVFLANDAAMHQPFRQVAYGGEVVGIYIGAGTYAAFLSGYLFEERAGAVSDPPEADYHPIRIPIAKPAELAA